MSTEMNMRRKIFLVITIACMTAIFLFSSRTREESTGDSYFVGNMVGEIFVPGFDEWSAQEQLEFAGEIDHPVRKTAHAMEYAVLGLLTAGAFIGRRTSILAGILVPWCIASVYAVTDEIHQLFVPGRSGQVSDVMLDSAGVLAGLLILAAVRMLRRRQREAAGSVHVD